MRRYLYLWCLITIFGNIVFFPMSLSARDLNLSPLHRAVYTNNTIILNSLLKKNPDVNVRAYRGITPLHMAANEGAKESVEALLKHGADPDLKDDKGRTALDLAFSNNHLDVVGILIPVTDNPANATIKDASKTAPKHDKE